METMENIEHEGLACYNVEINIGRSHFSDDIGMLVLETNAAPDYYSRAHFPPQARPKNWRLFVLVKKHIHCFQDIVLKKAFQINQSLEQNLEIMPGQMVFNKKSYQCIRINLEDISKLRNILTELETLGLEFLSDKKVSNFQTQIFFKRYTQLVKMEEGVYKDSKITGRYFFEIPKLVEFDEFQEGIKKIKTNCNYHLFDAFLSFMFVKGGIGQDFIGIYSDHCDETRFSELKQFVDEIFKK